MIPTTVIARLVVFASLWLTLSPAQNNYDSHPVTPYSSPTASASVIAPIRFDSATPLDPALHNRFQGCDDHDQCDGKNLKYKCSNDPNRNHVFLKLADGAIFFDAKMAIDADGAEFTKTTPGMTDQTDTSFRYSMPGNPSLDADKVPYIVVPGSEFEQPLGMQLGDIAAVVYRDRVVFAMVGDHGPKCKNRRGFNSPARDAWTKRLQKAGSERSLPSCRER